ncbi:MAG: class I SAM-dependent methyltransferase [Reyranellaceae bacterium]
MSATVDDDALVAFLAHLEKCWRKLGETQPHWSVLSAPIFRPDRIGETVEQFYGSGEHDVASLIEKGERFGLTFPRRGKCLELGCGVGRMTMWFARRFDRVVALDVSPSHLAIARRAVLKARCLNVELRLVSRPDAFDRLPEIDCFFSVIVLQHNPPPVIRWMLRKILSRLKPGGVGVFQLPTRIPGYTFNAADYLANLPTHGEMEMHALSRADVVGVVHEAGCELVATVEHDVIGIEGAESLDFFVRRLHT